MLLTFIFPEKSPVADFREVVTESGKGASETFERK